MPRLYIVSNTAFSQLYTVYEKAACVHVHEAIKSISSITALTCKVFTCKYICVAFIVWNLVFN